MLRPPRVGSGSSFLVSPCFGTFSHAKDNMGGKRRESRRLCTSLRKPAVWLFYFLDFFLFYCCDFWYVFLTIKNYIEFYLNFAHVYAQVGAAKVSTAPPPPLCFPGVVPTFVCRKARSQSQFLILLSCLPATNLYL